MANQIEGVSDRLIECATEEFLQKGFANASLRTIAENAKTSTNSIYVRFGDKAGLFSAIVDKAMKGLQTSYKDSIKDFEKNYSIISYEEMYKITDKYIDEMVRYIYDNFTSFQLLICCSDGTDYNSFIDDLIEAESKESILYIERIKSDAISSGNVSLTFIHMINTAYFSGLFEIVRHRMSWQEATGYLKQLKDFFRAGWIDIFNKLK